jgi:hypothetical protein
MSAFYGASLVRREIRGLRRKICEGMHVNCSIKYQKTVSIVQRQHGYSKQRLAT